MPHVDKCQSCEKCHIGELNHQKGIQGQKLLTGRRLSREQTPQIIVRPLQIDPPDRSNLPNCTECYGCQHELTSLNTELKAFNSTFRFDNGRTSAQIFKVKDPIQSYPEKPTVVKLWCVEVWNEGKGAVPKCKPHRANEAIQVSIIVNWLSYCVQWKFGWDFLSLMQPSAYLFRTTLIIPSAFDGETCG